MTKTVEERLRDVEHRHAIMSREDRAAIVEAADLIKELRETLAGLLHFEIAHVGSRVTAARTALKRAEARNG